MTSATIYHLGRNIVLRNPCNSLLIPIIFIFIFISLRFIFIVILIIGSRDPRSLHARFSAHPSSSDVIAAPPLGNISRTRRSDKPTRPSRRLQEPLSLLLTAYKAPLRCPNLVAPRLNAAPPHWVSSRSAPLPYHIETPVHPTRKCQITPCYSTQTATPVNHSDSSHPCYM